MAAVELSIPSSALSPGKGQSRVSDGDSSGSPKKHSPKKSLGFNGVDSDASKGSPGYFERPKKSLLERFRERCRQLTDSWRFASITMALTLYALFGDDLRLAATYKRTDTLFNILTVSAIITFSMEIIAASVGKEEYFLGFFFGLDFVSTLTLFLDLTWVGDAIFCPTLESESEGNALRSSSAGRDGARASRTVRIIRLVRIIKLYKSYRASVEQKERQKRKSRQSESEEIAPGEEEDAETLEKDMDLEDPENVKAAQPELHSETRVGKKLSDMTTRRVMIGVLLCLVTMPNFSPPGNDFRSSASTAIDYSYARSREWCSMESDDPWCYGSLQAIKANTNATDTETVARHNARYWYEYYLLLVLYTHREAQGFMWNLYWLGLGTGSHEKFFASESDARAHLAQLGPLGQSHFLGDAALPPSQWDSIFTNTAWTRQIAPLPENVKTRLTQPWGESCLGFVGVPLSGEVDPDFTCSNGQWEELRCSERDYNVAMTKTDKETSGLQMLFVFDMRGQTQLEAALSMLQTVFICFMVGYGAMSFSSDANQLLLNPIERMVAKMEAIKDNPLEAMKLGDKEYRLEEIEKQRVQDQLARKGRLAKMVYRMYKNRRTKEPMETVILEKTIIKLGGLLALGFGEAGAEIIGQNMKGSASSGVNAVVPGQKVDAIIGFCSIRNFTDATEVLKEKVMLFVNQVGEIVHGCVDDYHGAPNKNIGDSFLLVWRLSGAGPEKQSKLADMSLMSFIRCVAAINKSPTLEEYRGHPGMLQRVRDYRVQMGFGLHCGWAIEGAIGSAYKIDASYLSPNVNVAARLEAATKQFGVWLLVSHFMISLCSREMAAISRLIDHVTVKGSKQPVRLYTIDLDYMKVNVEYKCMENVIKNRFKVRQVREFRKAEKMSDDFKVWEAFDSDEDLLLMRSTYSEEFFQRFSMAYRNYEAGEWLVARDMMFTCHYAAEDDREQVAAEDQWPEDGPVVTLLNYMKSRSYQPPVDWPGHRELTEK